MLSEPNMLMTCPIMNAKITPFQKEEIVKSDKIECLFKISSEQGKRDNLIGYEKWETSTSIFCFQPTCINLFERVARTRKFQNYNCLLKDCEEKIILLTIFFSWLLLRVSLVFEHLID
jgi:hypothetical protein